jgi:hypothetical protein
MRSGDLGSILQKAIMPGEAERLRRFEWRVFDPILRARKADHKGPDQRPGADVQSATRSDKERFRSYCGVPQNQDNFVNDMHPETKKRIDKELRRLELARPLDIKGEFVEFADDGRQTSGARTPSGGGH